MKKRRNSQIQAEKNYEQKRHTVACKLFEDELATLDRVRGEQSRTAFVKDAILRRIAELSA